MCYVEICLEIEVNELLLQAIGNHNIEMGNKLKLHATWNTIQHGKIKSSCVLHLFGMLFISPWISDMMLRKDASHREINIL